MSETTIYECPKCEDRKMLQWKGEGLAPNMWCSCDGFNIMETVEV